MLLEHHAHTSLIYIFLALILLILVLSALLLMVFDVGRLLVFLLMRVRRERRKWIPWCELYSTCMCMCMCVRDHTCQEKTTWVSRSVCGETLVFR
jgi:hypothetical protein